MPTREEVSLALTSDELFKKYLTNSDEFFKATKYSEFTSTLFQKLLGSNELFASIIRYHSDLIHITTNEYPTQIPLILDKILQIEDKYYFLHLISNSDELFKFIIHFPNYRNSFIDKILSNDKLFNSFFHATNNFRVTEELEQFLQLFPEFKEKLVDHIFSKIERLCIFLLSRADIEYFLKNFPDHQVDIQSVFEDKQSLYYQKDNEITEFMEIMTVVFPEIENTLFNNLLEFFNFRNFFWCQFLSNNNYVSVFLDKLALFPEKYHSLLWEKAIHVITHSLLLMEEMGSNEKTSIISILQTDLIQRAIDENRLSIVLAIDCQRRVRKRLEKTDNNEELKQALLSLDTLLNSVIDPSIKNLRTIVTRRYPMLTREEISTALTSDELFGREIKDREKFLKACEYPEFTIPLFQRLVGSNKLFRNIIRNHSDLFHITKYNCPSEMLLVLDKVLQIDKHYFLDYIRNVGELFKLTIRFPGYRITLVNKIVSNDEILYLFFRSVEELIQFCQLFPDFKEKLINNSTFLCKFLRSPSDVLCCLKAFSDYRENIINILENVRSPYYRNNLKISDFLKLMTIVLPEIESQLFNNIMSKKIFRYFICYPYSSESDGNCITSFLNELASFPQKYQSQLWVKAIQVIFRYYLKEAMNDNKIWVISILQTDLILRAIAEDRLSRSLTLACQKQLRTALDKTDNNELRQALLSLDTVLSSAIVPRLKSLCAVIIRNHFFLHSSAQKILPSDLQGFIHLPDNQTPTVRPT